MSVEQDLVTGIAELLDREGIADWSPGAAYSGDGPVIAMGDAPAGPDQAVTLTAYPVQDDPHYADALYGVQARIRGTRDIRTTWDTAGRIRDVLHGATALTLGGVHVIECHRQSSAPLGRDENGRWEQSDTYYLQAHTPTAHRPY